MVLTLALCAALAQADALPLPEDSMSDAGPSPIAGAPAGSAELAFAESLAREGDYYRAIGELKRALHGGGLKPQDSDQARDDIGWAYLYGGQPDAAHAHYLRERDQGTGIFRRHADLQLAYCLLAAGKLGEAEEGFSRWLSLHEKADYARRERALHLSGVGFLALDLPEAARGRFEALEEGPVRARLLQGVDEVSSRSTRSPFLAGLLALVPGLGHVYVGQPLIGLGSLVGNALFAFATVDAARRGFLGAAMVFGLVELLFYGGNIVGAVSAAQKYNRDSLKNVLEAVRHDAPDRPETWVHRPQVR